MGKISYKDIEKWEKKGRVDKLVGALEDEDPYIRTEAARSLWLMGDARAMEPLVQSLMDPVEGVRFFAMQALGKIGDPRAVGPIAYRWHCDENLHEAITKSLQAIGGPEAEGALAALREISVAMPGPPTAVSAPGSTDSGDKDETVPTPAAQPAASSTGIGTAERDLRVELSSAVFFGDIEKARACLAEGADANEGDTLQGFTPLHQAAKNGHVEIGQLLLDSGADVEARNFEGRTPLHQAAEGNSMEGAVFLLDMGAAVDARSDKRLTPLHAAAADGFVELAMLFLDRGADINARAVNGWTPLGFALAHNRAEMAELLRARGGIE